ncbi:MAG: hypothetical protein K6A45_00610 [Lachnospiraceae bacterium]|nr:hypothetical protein [Lachnospiraceae bacterium]
MLSGKRFRGCFILIMLLFSTCLLVTGCTRNVPEVLNLSENAVFYNYSGDNILSLKSIIVDSESQDNRIIFEFDDDSEYVSQNVIESIIAKKTKYPNRIEGESVNGENNTKVEAIFDNGSIYIVLNFDPNIECNNLYINYGYFIEIRGPWDAPFIDLTRFSVNKDGVDGDISYYQTYDMDRQKWNEGNEYFYENLPPVLD